MGGSAVREIPLLSMLFYLHHDVAPAWLRGRTVLVVSSGSAWASYVEDIVRWGVWLGRHIC